MKEGWLLYDIIFIIVILGLFLPLWLEFFRGGRNLLNKSIFFVIPIIIVVILLGIYLEGGNNLTVNHFKTSAIFNICTLIGIGITTLGVFLAFKQFKLAEDKISGYEQLYDEIFSLIDDKRMKQFLFLGPTIIPGHITYGNTEKLKRYIEKIMALISDKEKNLTFITFNEEVTIVEYGKYNTAKIEDRPLVDTVTQDEINAKIKELNDLRNHIKMSKTMIEVGDNSTKGYLSDYIISNGRTVIFVSSLHYLERMKDGINKKIKPTLIGYKTTDPIFVLAFENRFNNIKNEIENEPRNNTK